MEILPPPFVEQTAVEDKATVDIACGKEQGNALLYIPDYGELKFWPTNRWQPHLRYQSNDHDANKFPK